jgi:hypothetical protein
LNSTLQPALLASTPLSQFLSRGCTPSPFFDVPTFGRSGSSAALVGRRSDRDVETFLCSEASAPNSSKISTRKMLPFCTILVHSKPSRINTCKNVSKQTTLAPSRINTYEKQAGWGRVRLPVTFQPSNPLIGATQVWGRDPDRDGTFKRAAALSPLFSSSYRHTCTTDAAQPFWNQSVARTFHHDGGCTPPAPP